MTRAAAAQVSEAADALLNFAHPAGAVSAGLAEDATGAGGASASGRSVAGRPTAAGSRGRSVRRRLIWHK